MIASGNLVIWGQAGGINFAVHYRAATGLTLRPHWRDVEVRVFVSFIVGALVVIASMPWLLKEFDRVHEAFTNLLFEFVSVITITGFGTAVFSTWPSFPPLLTARKRLEDVYSQELVLTAQPQNVHRALESAFTALNKAQLDPTEQRGVDTLRTRLRTFEDIERLERTSPAQLQQAYHEISAQLSEMIEKLERVKQ